MEWRLRGCGAGLFRRLSETSISTTESRFHEEDGPHGAAGRSPVSHWVGRAVLVASIFFSADWAAVLPRWQWGVEMNSVWSALAGSLLMCALAAPTCSRGAGADADRAEGAGRTVAAPNSAKGSVAAKAPTPGAEKSRINAASAASSPPVSRGGDSSDAASPASMPKGEGASPVSPANPSGLKKPY